MDETMRILKMVEEGIVTAEQGAELLSALKATQPEEETSLAKIDYDKKMLRIIVDAVEEGDKVRIQFPVGAVRRILKATGKLPIPEKDLEGVDISELLNAVSDCLDEEIEGDFINVEAADGTTVRIFVDK